VFSSWCGKREARRARSVFGDDGSRVGNVSRVGSKTSAAKKQYATECNDAGSCVAATSNGRRRESVVRVRACGRKHEKGR